MHNRNPAFRVADIAARWARVQPDAPAIVDDSGTWRYAELQRALDGTAEWLRAQGAGAGERIVLVGENCRAFAALYLAVASLDAWPVLVHANQTPAEIERIRHHAGARCVIYAAATPRTRQLAEASSGQSHEIAQLGQVVVAQTDTIARPEAVESDPAGRVAAVIYTSGSEGAPKGVMLTNANLLFAARTSGELRHLAPDQRMYAVVPMSHSLGLSIVTLGTLWHGATLRQTVRFDPAAAMMAFEREAVTVLIGTPMMYQLLVEFARRKGIARPAAPALRVISTAGAPLTADVKAETESLFGMTLHNGYGVTECAPTISQTLLEAPRQDCSVGPSWPGIEVRIDTAPGEDAGEILVRGPNVMKGYYRNPELTADALNDGWFNTRDLGRLDSEGNLFIVGRSRELIVRFGYKMLPVEIEAVLERHPAVARSAVVGRTIAGHDEIIAYVEPAPFAQVSEAALAAHCASELPAQKRPTRYVLLASLPVSPAGKIRKSELPDIAPSPTRPRDSEAQASLY